MGLSRKALRCSAAATALLLALALVPVAGAGADPLGAGRTSLKLSAELSRQLQRNHVPFRGLKPAKAQSRTVSLPVREGQLDAASGSGSVLQAGGIGFGSGSRIVKLRHIVFDTARGRLSALIGGRALSLATIRGITAAREGLGVYVGIAELRLTSRAARILNRKLGLAGVFEAGRSLGTASTTAQFRTVTVLGGTIGLTFDEGFRGKLQALGITVGPFESAQVVSAMRLAFAIPMLPGSLAPDLSQGALVSADGLRLTQGAGAQTRELVLSGVSLALDSRVASAGMGVQPGSSRGVAPFASLDLSVAVAQLDPRTGTVLVPSVPATLSPYAVGPLNEAFPPPPGQPASFAAGESLGTFSITAQTR